jgi:hypothetical protein
MKKGNADVFPETAFGSSTKTKGCMDTGSKPKKGKKGRGPNYFPQTAFGSKP